MVYIYLIALSLIIISPACSGPGISEYTRIFHIMGSKLEIRLYTDSKDLFYKITNESLQRAKEIDRMFSNYRDDSVLQEVNKYAGKSEVRVPQEFIDLTKRSVKYSRITKGSFDITVGKLFDLWKEKGKENVLPTPDELKETLGCTGFQKIKIENKSISFETDCLEIDFGGIGKGYVVDQIVEIIKAHGVYRGIVNFGGNIYSIGSPPGSQFWEVGIKDPVNSRDLITTVGINNHGVATSGDYEKYFEIEGTRYSHIINPKNALPVKDRTSVTVIADSATEADALSTAFSVMGPDDAAKFITNNKDIAFIFMVKTDNGYRIYKSESFKKYENNLDD